MEIEFEKLDVSDLMVDAVYKGGTVGGKGAEVLSKLMPGCSNSGGFRKVMRKDGSGLPAYVVLYTSMQELAWPDYLDEETGIFRYYGDNRNPGRAILDTPRKGNQLLEFVFGCLNSKDGSIRNIPPFFVFKKTGRGWDVQFLGLAAPGNPHISPDRDLVAFWRTLDEKRFQNYEAYFTILQTPCAISKEWIHALVYEHEKSFELAPYSLKKGDVLVEGGVPIMNEDSTVRRYDYCRADADIMLRCTYQMKEELKEQYEQKQYTGNERRSLFIMFGTKKLKLPAIGKRYEEYDVIEEKKQLRLFENYYLPVYIGSDLVREYVVEEKIYSQSEVKILFEEKLQKFIENLQEKGVQIIEKNVTINKVSGVWKMKVDFLAIEKTGTERKTQLVQVEEAPQEEEIQE